MTCLGGGGRAQCVPQKAANMVLRQKGDAAGQAEEAQMCLRWLLQSQAAKLSKVGVGQGECGCQDVGCVCQLGAAGCTSCWGCSSASVMNAAMSSPVP